MIYAVPHNHECVANHFMKAAQFTLFNNSTWVETIANPAATESSSCRDKSAAMQLLKQHKAEAVIVRNIGERSLGKLLAAGIRVFQVGGKTPLHLANQAPLTELTDASQGRLSTNHHKKGGCGGHRNDGNSCGCGSQHNPLMAPSSGQHGKKRAIRGLRSGILSVGKFK